MTFAQGKPIDSGMRAARACITLGIEGGPNPAAKAAVMEDLKAAVRRYLLASP